MTIIYSLFKKLVPQSLRTFIRDLDSAYRERLTEIDIKNQQILELEKKYEDISQKMETLMRDLDSAYQQRLTEIDIKNQQILELEKKYENFSQKMEPAKNDIQKQQVLAKTVDNSNLSDEEYEKLSKAGLFIVGNARSGTSILCSSLNLSSEVFLLGEANLALHYNLDDFVDFYNNQHILFKNPKFKGTSFAPPSRLIEKGAFPFLLRMNKNYKFIGEKVAFGPHGINIDNKSHQELFFNFHARYFYFSKYIIIIRRPTETVWSMLKMFPDISLNLLFESWLRTLLLKIDIICAFPNSYVLFFESLSCETILSLCSYIEINNINIPENMFTKKHQNSLLDNYEIPEELSIYSDICLACENIYKQVQDVFCFKTFQFKEIIGSSTAPDGYTFITSTQNQINNLLYQLQQAKE
ncbi:hypothetical protein [Nostoc sp. FACHB-110]|uniref:hypothetical protein n=1 Tax=Nostoc sp. FACHB-110 TaxID=2692834 RepID=UPI0016837941|nr:hypothetical protein [Nostoc sp. FACHB-110]MBD2436141.1 hypothetical protein [Nostoc sp. FACHB-110]